jgi:hypothetical protein
MVSLSSHEEWKEHITMIVIATRIDRSADMMARRNICIRMREND